MNKKSCGILFLREHSHVDNHGCLKPHAHNDSHIFLDHAGRFIEWEDDYACKCGCWDDYDKGDPNVCGVYQDITQVIEEKLGPNDIPWESYCYVRDVRNHLRDKFPSADYRTANLIKKKIKELDKVLTIFETNNPNHDIIYNKYITLK